MPRNKRFLCLAAATATCIIAISILIVAPAAPAQTQAQAPAHAPAGTGSISGNVSDHQGSPLAGAQVTLTNLATKETTNGSTDGTGAYSFEDLKPGHYTVVFESKGLITKTESIEVRAGKKSKVSERLRPPELEKKKDVEGVFVVKKDGAVDFRPIKTGISAELQTEVLEGLADGEEIVTGPFKALRSLKIGDRVKVDNSAAGPDAEKKS